MALRSLLPLALAVSLTAAPVLTRAQAQPPSPPPTQHHWLTFRNVLGVAGCMGVIYGGVTMSIGGLALLAAVGTAAAAAAAGITVGGALVLIATGLAIGIMGSVVVEWALSMPDPADSPDAGSNADRGATTTAPAPPAPAGSQPSPGGGVTR